MNKSMMVGAALGAVVATAGGAFATYSLVDRGPQFAEVLAVEPIKETVRTPREVCRDVTVTRQKPVQDQHRIAGTASGLWWAACWVTRSVAAPVRRSPRSRAR